MKTQNFSFFAFEIATNNFDNIKTEIEKLEFGTHEGVVLVFNVVSFDVGKLPLIIELFAQKQLVVVAVKTTIIEIIEFATFSNIATVDDISPSAVPLSSPTSPQPQSLHSSRPSIIRTDIKSHEQIYVKNTDLVILGDVNSGAEVISDKNIYIYGGGYGKIFAGLTNKNARIFNSLPLDITSPFTLQSKISKTKRTFAPRDKTFYYTLIYTNIKVQIRWVIGDLSITYSLGISQSLIPFRNIAIFLA
jgi:septum site-determining protein MinC